MGYGLSPDSPKIRYRQGLVWRFRQKEAAERCVRNLGEPLKLLESRFRLTIFPLEILRESHCECFGRQTSSLPSPLQQLRPDVYTRHFRLVFDSPSRESGTSLRPNNYDPMGT